MTRLDRPISHIGYAVADLEEAAHRWTSILGAGPFFLVPNISFDELSTADGEPALFGHSSVFGQWGSIAVELMQMETTGPPSVTRKLTPGTLPVINHVAYISKTPQQDSAELAAAGHKLFLYGKSGEMEIRWHDSQAALGHTVEIHRHCDFITRHFRRIAAAAKDWDGADPYRPMAWDD